MPKILITTKHSVHNEVDHKAATNSTQFALRKCDGTAMITLPAANYVLRVHKDTLFASIL